MKCLTRGLFVFLSLYCTDELRFLMMQFQVGLNRVADVDTNILYVTTGVLVEKLIHGRGLNQWTHIILDEVHERSQDMDLCLLLVRQLMREERSDTRLLLMSASADITRLAEYFSTIDLDHPFGDAMLSEEESEERDGLRLVKPPVVTVAGRLFDVSVFYIEDVHQLFEKVTYAWIYMCSTCDCCTK